MSLHDCIQRAIDSGDLPPRQARRAQALFATRLQAHAHLGQGAEAMAAEDVWIALRRENIRARRGVAMQAKAQMGIAEALARHRDSDGEANAASGLRQFLQWGGSATHQSVESTRQALAESYLGDISALIETHKINILGNVRQKAKLPNLVRELYGEATGDPHAKAMADAVGKTMERARREHNAAGGEIGKLEGWGLPHHWDRSKVTPLTPEGFAARLQDQLDWGRIIDRDTEQPFSKSSAAARTAFLQRTYHSIRTGGWDTREPSGAAFGRSLAKSRSDHRLLHFKSADAWLAVNDELGTADPFSAVIEHLHGMARDTAQMRILGPNPGAGLEYARQAALKLAHDRPWTPRKLLPIKGGHGIEWHETAEDEVKAVAAQAQRMLGLISGAANHPESAVFANVMAQTRHFLVAAKLGGALLSAIPGDSKSVGFESFQVGMSPGKVLARHFKTLALPENRAILVRTRIIAESAASTGVVQARLMNEGHSRGIMQRLSEFTMRASGLTAWTDIARGVFKLEFYGHMADNAHLPFDRIDPTLRDNILVPRGFTAADWEVIRATPLYRDRAEPDAAFLIPDDIRRREDLDPDLALDLSLKLSATVFERRELAVPTGSLRAKANLQALAPPGTPGGEALRSIGMFKSYTMSTMMNGMAQVLYHKVRGNRVGNVLAWAALGTLAGAVTVQLKDVALGRDPRPMNTREFWGAAALQGGGLGIFGDFLSSSQNRFGGGFASTVAGPVAGLAADIGFLGNALIVATSGDPEKVDAAQREMIRFANNYAGPTNIWWANAALDRLLWDTISEWLDPDAAAAFDRAAKKRRKEYGNTEWWRRGQLIPDRAPDFRNLFAPAAGAQP